MSARTVEFNSPLKTHALRLGNQEPHEEKHREGEAAEDKICAVAILSHRLQHVWNGLCNNKVEQPLRSSCQRNVHGTKSSSGDLRDDDPAARAPSELEESSKEENACQSKVTDARDARGDACNMWWGRVKADIEANDEHCKPLSDGGPKQGLSSAQ